MGEDEIRTLIKCFSRAALVQTKPPHDNTLHSAADHLSARIHQYCPTLLLNHNMLGMDYVLLYVYIAFTSYGILILCVVHILVLLHMSINR